MKDAFQAYPELLCLDATYKLLELGLPVYLMLCEDSNGLSEIVCVSLLVSEDANSITWMIEALKQHNVHWENIRVVMADKDIRERDVIKKCLPNVSVLICLFHTLRSFKREVTCEKMGISSGQRTLCLELLQKMAHAPSESDYMALYSQFQNDAPREVVIYFNTNWHQIRSEWVLGMKFVCGSFLNSTNNRLESINGKLKQVISKHSSLEDFVYHFFIILTALRTERDHRAAVMFQKVKVHPFPANSPESEYSKILTSYALGFVLKQMKLAEKVKEIKENRDGYIVHTSEGERSVSLSHCDCIFHTAMSLPCRHMFALRAFLEKPLYDGSLCEKRWTLTYYRATQRIFSTSTGQPKVVQTTSISKCRKLSQHEKFRKALVLTSELATVASEASHVHFQRRLDVLGDLISHWKTGNEVTIIEVETGM